MAKICLKDFRSVVFYPERQEKVEPGKSSGKKRKIGVNKQICKLIYYLSL